MREMAYMEGPPLEPDDDELVADEEFDAEVAAVAEGRFEDAGLDRLPDDWQTATIEDLRADS